MEPQVTCRCESYADGKINTSWDSYCCGLLLIATQIKLCKTAVVCIRRVQETRLNLHEEPRQTSIERTNVIKSKRNALARVSLRPTPVS